MNKDQKYRLAQLLFSPTLTEPFDLNSDLALMCKIRSKDDLAKLQSLLTDAHTGVYDNPFYHVKIV